MNKDLLTSIANATAASTILYISASDDAKALVQAGYIEVNKDMVDPEDNTKVAARVTDAGVQYLNSQGQNPNEGKKPMSNYEVQSGGFEAPKAKRGGGGAGAPSKYPFATMEVGAFFFVGNGDVAKGDAYKTLGSVTASANDRFSEETGVMKTVKRAQRDPNDKKKALKGPDGKNIMETVEVAEKRQLKKFKVSRVEGGKQYGSFTAPSDGAVVSRVG